MNWLWFNIPLMAAFFIAVAGIPLWLVLRRPDFGPQAADQPGGALLSCPARPRSAPSMLGADGEVS